MLRPGVQVGFKSLAGLVAEGQTTVYGVGHIDRGYAGFVPALQSLGAQVVRDEIAD